MTMSAREPPRKMRASPRRPRTSREFGNESRGSHLRSRSLGPKRTKPLRVARVAAYLGRQNLREAGENDSGARRNGF